MTLVWHVNDLNVSYKDPFKANKFTTYLYSIYRNYLIVHRVKVINYLGVDLD